MRARKFTVWDCYKDRLLSRGETLAKDFGGYSLPISLSQIAKARAVRNVIFRPLLVDGCLTVIDNGFKIYVRCKKEYADEMRTRFDAETKLGALPQRMRFTVAHEIAHTLFYKINDGRPKHPLSVKHQRRLRTLENVCNKVAARILLPTDLLRAELRNASRFDPETLRRLADKAAVSGPMLVNRLREAAAWTHEPVVVAYLEPDEGLFSFRAIGVHDALRNYFPIDAVGISFSDFCPVRGFFLNGGSEFDADLDVRCETRLSKGVRRFHFQCENPQSRAQHRGIFFTANPVGDAVLT